MAPHLLLPSLLSNSKDLGYSSNASPLILITDSLVQPGLLLLRQFISSALSRSDEQAVVVALEQSPARLLPFAASTGASHANLQLVDAVSSLSKTYASTSAVPLGDSFLDLYQPNGVQYLVKAVVTAIERAQQKSSSVLVVLDSVDRLHELAGMHGVHSTLQAVLKALSTKKYSTSRLVALHHHAFPSPAPTPSSTSSALLAYLLSPSLSSSTVHLTLHPSPLVELLSCEYTLQIPLTPHSSTPIDLRLPEFLTSFNDRSYGDPFKRPCSTRDEDERIPLDLLGSSGNDGGACVVEWSTRGVVLPTQVLRNSIGGMVNGKIERRVLTRGVEGVIKKDQGVQGVGLDRVLRKDRMASVVRGSSSSSLCIVRRLRNQPVGLQNLSSLATPSTTAKPASSKPTKSSRPANSIEVPLPFNLSLTSSQESARSSVPLPFVAKEGDAAMYQGLGGVGKVEYEPDEGDDMDDDDPDEDLEV
ncbi:BZ3500_MvSof-1268-A1-R1_Chr3-1g05966 [Microbotryum saponariae]|uniref:Elongator complex protein 5 n=1 Tax=Microbotryum saponariae TaxID=289078 RepID=A0A2X0NHQ9_9BASI|nr:BZ3500_MvSof-1268-A1-R1_Chr3-1g05966 [Microbotryum saponariae]SDA05156.1 BZ3501_MvSof-1269-A2-R1_Chr3-1g05636 [Microbotryum saponariae]